MKKLLSLSLLALMCASVFAQQVVLTFTGRDADNHFLPLSRVVIGNQTRGWQETICYPDTTLSFGATGISDYAANGSFGLAQNNPNPFNGATDVNLTVAEPGAVTMEIADVNGKIVETYGRASLPTKNGEKGHTDNPFSIGDEMVYIGYAIVNGTEYASQTIHQNQLVSETFVLNFNVTYEEPTGFDGQPCPGTPTLTDIDGNTYNTVQIGNQCWMKENLRTTKKPNGTSISSGIWTPGSNSVTTYGRLYSWSTVMNGASSSSANPSGVQGICPTGWHVPSDNEWKQMEMAVGMSQSDVDDILGRGNIAAKLCGNTGWYSSSIANAAGNLNAPDRNSRGFSALPAGRYLSSYCSFGNNALFWSATEDSSDFAYDRLLYYNNAGVGRRTSTKTCGYSVRCVRD